MRVGEQKGRLGDTPVGRSRDRGNTGWIQAVHFDRASSAVRAHVPRLRASGPASQRAVGAAGESSLPACLARAGSDLKATNRLAGVFHGL